VNYVKERGYAPQIFGMIRKGAKTGFAITQYRVIRNRGFHGLKFDYQTPEVRLSNFKKFENRTEIRIYIIILNLIISYLIYPSYFGNRTSGLPSGEEKAA
jgi:hypothetical protein